MKSEHGPSWCLTTIVLLGSGAAVGKITLGLFYAEFDYELNTKVEKNSPKFPTVIYTLNSVSGQNSG
jgi:hypothetical protein